jgi:hypothetical protein
VYLALFEKDYEIKELGECESVRVARVAQFEPRSSQHPSAS